MLRTELKNRIDQFTSVYKYAGIHASKPHENDKLVELKDDLFEGITILSMEIVDKNCKTIEEATLIFVVVGNAMAKECAKYFNEAKIPFYQPFELTSAPDPVELDERFFMICMTQLPPDQLRAFMPVLEDFFILDRFEHPDYIGPDINAIINHIRKEEEPVPDEAVHNMTPMEDIAAKDVVKEYFKTFKDLKKYIGSGEYDDPNAKILYDRMNALEDRLLEN